MLFALSRLQESSERLDPQISELILTHKDPFSPPGLRYVGDVQESMDLQARDEPCIVIAGAGMCEGGRILFHFARGIEDARNSIVMVGFMAQHTLGRRIAEKQRSVRVLGIMRDLRAEVVALEGLSAHADRNDLLAFASAIARRGELRSIALVHGEREARSALAADLKERLSLTVMEAEPGERLALSAS